MPQRGGTHAIWLRAHLITVYSITTDRKIKEISASFFKSSFFTVSEAGSDFELKKEEKISLMSV